MTYKYVILGGGLTAGYAAQEFVKHGLHPGDLCIVSAEKTLPYERPPLSKDFLADDKTKEDILINAPSFYEEQGIEVKLHSPVTRVDLENKRLYTENEAIAYEKLLIATGARPRTFDLPGADLDNIFYLRQIDDARQIREQAQQAEKAVVIGGSFIGMEATSVLQSGGVDTTLLFPEERVWQSFFTPEMSEFFTDYYQKQGVTIMPETGVASFGGNGRLAHIITSAGQQIPADLVVAGIGVVPNSELFTDTPLQMKEGYILVNRFLETNMPDVYAAGDITQYRDLIYEQTTTHVEHWDNAVAQGCHAACAMLGLSQPFEHVPYFFSDVFDLSYEFWGDTGEAVETVTRGDRDSGSFSVWWLGENGRLLAAFIMDRPEEERKVAPEWIKSGKKLSTKFIKENKELASKELAAEGA